MICAKCGNTCTRVSNGKPVCTPCFIQGWGRLPLMPLPEEKAPLYVSDKPPKPAKKGRN